MKKKIILGALVLLLGALFISGSYALFKSSGSGQANISAATWSVSLIGNDDDIDLTSGSTEQGYIVTVKNESEVSVTYSIKVTNLPDDVAVKLDTGQYKSEEDNEVIFEDVGELLINGTKQRNHTLTFTAPIDAGEVSNHKIKIDVEFKQKTS